MQLSPGTQLSSYEIKAALGAGGMGEVYRARDPKLERDVAIKVLPPDFADNPERLARFEREAKALAALNHPNIATLHGFEQDGDTRFLVMELAEGEDLAERLKRGPLRVDEAIPLFAQIAKGLEAAHEKGIVHRDLKPANIMVSEDGRAKILDFGLAKALDPAPSDADLSNSPTMTAATLHGAILGTAAYMSPEQASGKTVDKRSDIWSFGVCLYETLTGERAFKADDVSHTLAAVLRDDLDLSRLPADCPNGLRRLLQRCLVRDRKKRLRDIGDARLELEAEPLEEGLPREVGGSRRRAPWLLAVAAAAVGGALTLALLQGQLAEPSTAPRVVRSSLQLPDHLRIDVSEIGPLSISRDGSKVVYSATDGRELALYLRHLDGFESTRLPGTEGGSQPFLSPDGEWVGFWAGNALKKLSLSGGSPTTLDSGPESLGHSWGPDDRIVFQSMATGLLSVDSQDGNLRQVTSTSEDGAFFHGWPAHAPGGGLLFSRWGYEKKLMFWPTDGEPAELPLRDGTSGLITASGHLMYLATEIGRGLNAVPIELKTGKVEGTPVNVLPDVQYFGAATFSVSETGTLVYLEDATDQAQLTWVTPSGEEAPIDIEIPDLLEPRLSPDERYALASSDQGRSVWLVDLERGVAAPLFEQEARRTSGNAIWAPDGSITFSSNRTGNWELYRLDPDASGKAELLLELRGYESPKSWSPDGRTLILQHVGIEKDSTGAGDTFDLWTLDPRSDPPSAMPLFETSASEVDATFSPDGSRIAYVSNKSGAFEVYLTTFPPGQETVVSRGGGREPRWSPDGKVLYFRKSDQLLAAALRSADGVEVERVEVLFEQPYLSRSVQTYSAHYDVSNDGECFLFVSNMAAREIQVVQNWFEELNRLVPID